MTQPMTNASRTSSRQFRDQIVGKRITHVVASPGRSGRPPQVLMMHFDDGSVVEFVSPRSDRILKQALAGGSCAPSRHQFGAEDSRLQLSLLA
jgi:hypothetical protein